MVPPPNFLLVFAQLKPARWMDTTQERVVWTPKESARLLCANLTDRHEEHAAGPSWIQTPP